MTESPMRLGVEIGGTKLQAAVGSDAGGPLAVLERRSVDPARGAEGIREQIVRLARPMIERWEVERIGVGFGGPVDAASGRVITSHQIAGWDGFPLADWCGEALGRPAVIENDSNLAGLGEACFGAGRGESVVVYSNVGSGIGGALVIEGELYRGGAGAAVAEIGHLRPGLEATASAETVESLASGWSIAARARERLRDDPGRTAAARELLDRCGGDANRLTGKHVVEACGEGNSLAAAVFQQSLRAYGWALAQAITLLAPNIVVIGGGVAQAGERFFFAPLREQVRRYVFPPLRDAYRIAPAELGEEVVVRGALALAGAGL